MKNLSKTLALVVASGLAATVAFTVVAQNTAPAAPAKQEGTKESRKEMKKEEKATEKASRAEVGKPAPNFTLKTTGGKEWSLSDAAGKIVVLEWCNPECPACQRVSSDGTVLETIRGATEASKDVVYVMINSSAASTTSLEGTAAYLKEHKINTPALLDSEGKVGMMFGAKTTPHCYVIDSKGVLRYQGAIDDGNGGTKGKMNYVVNAVKQIAANETVSPAETKAYGCSVKYKK